MCFWRFLLSSLATAVVMMATEATVEPPARCSVGPVIGRVTTGAARVLVELDAAVSVLTMTLQPTAGAAAATAATPVAVSVTRADVPANRPVAFTVEGLVAGTSYSVHLSAPAKGSGDASTAAAVSAGAPAGSGAAAATATVPSREAVVRTPTPHLVPGRRGGIACVSCNKVYVNRRTHKQHKKLKGDAWASLQRRVAAGDVDVVLHMGDQVYADHELFVYKKSGADGGAGDPATFLNKLRSIGEDCAYLRAKLLLLAFDKKDWPAQRPAIREFYREVYRETWQWPTTAYVLAHASNVMVMDDHEIVDDWGQVEADYDPTTPEHFIARCGYDVFLEYQAALRLEEPVPLPTCPPGFEAAAKAWAAAESTDSAAEAEATADAGAETKEDGVGAGAGAGAGAGSSSGSGSGGGAPVYKEYLHYPALLPAYGVGLLTLDSRGKTFAQAAYPYTNPEEKHTPLLGGRQWADLTAALGPGGTFDAVRVLVVVSPLPLLFLGTGLNDLVAKKIDDAHGNWAARRNVPELVRVLVALRDWKERPLLCAGSTAAPGSTSSGTARRELVLVGGDIHVGAITDVFYRPGFKPAGTDGSPEVKGEGRSRLLCRQMITSPICNITISPVQSVGVGFAAELGSNFADGAFEFEHERWETLPNYGIVHVSPPATAGAAAVAATTAATEASARGAASVQAGSSRRVIPAAAAAAGGTGKLFVDEDAPVGSSVSLELVGVGAPPTCWDKLRRFCCGDGRCCCC